jgi:cell division protein FtsQ
LATAAIVGVLITLVGLVLTAVYSPILALRTITVEGTSRVSAEQVMAAVDEQMGTPLALIDYGKITNQLGAFPLIRSYVTETIPPSTLIIHVVERAPVGAIKSGSTFQLVDPAGVVVQESSERVAGIPVIDIGGAATSSAAFDSVVEVLISLPAALLAHDDVTLVLTGVGQRVIWGSATDSAAKAKLLAALIAVTDPGRAGAFDVSAPGNGVFRPA